LFISLEGAGSASSTERDAHSGQWWLVGDLIGDATLVLETRDGRTFLWTGVETADGAYLIDGERYTAGPSDRCR